MAKHNKKRNVGLIHEQLVKYASTCLVEGDKLKAEKAVQILENNFKDKSALQKEFRLFNALVHTKVPTRDLARKIIQESRLAAQSHDDKLLNSEKSILIRDINYKIDDKNFYHQQLSEYKVFATVQALLNEWRGSDKLGPEEIVKYESVLEDWLVRESRDESFDKSKHANPLTLKIMTEKFNKKYSNHFNNDQVDLLEARLSDDARLIEQNIEFIKTKAKKAISDFYASCDNKILLEKRSAVELKIENLQPNATDESISRALMLSQLIHEMEGNNE